MPAISEGAILLASLIGQLSKTDSDGIYRFEHKMMAPTATFNTYKSYLTRRLQHAEAWPSSAGCLFEPVGDITPLPDGRGFNVLVKPKV